MANSIKVHNQLRLTRTLSEQLNHSGLSVLDEVSNYLESYILNMVREITFLVLLIINE